MRIGIVSDTHGHVANTLAAINMLESLEVARVLHCGDIGTPEIPAFFKALADRFCVRQLRLCLATNSTAAIRAAGLTCHGVFGDLENRRPPHRTLAQRRSTASFTR